MTLPTHPGTQTARKRLSAQERRASILAAATEVFAERGYNGASLDEIAETASISKALIYEHFPSKRELQTALLEAQEEELVRRLTAAADPAKDPALRLRDGIDAFLGFVEENPLAQRMLFRDAGEPEVAEVLRRLRGEVVGVIAELMASDPAAEAIGEAQRERAIEALAQLLAGAVQGIADWWHDHAELSRDEIVDSVMEFAWLGLERLSSGERSKSL